MSYRRHTTSSAANTNKNQKWTGSIVNGMSNVATRLQTPLYVSENALPPDEETVAAIQNWLRIPAIGDTSQESILSTFIPGKDEFWTDPQFPPDATSLYVDPSQPPVSAPKDIVWERVRGQLYVPSSSGFKVTQGVYPCRWFMGALAAVAARPDLLLDLVVSDRGALFGVYTFQFYKHGCWQQVVIDNSIPFQKTGDEGRMPLLPPSANPSELWPSLIQKAYAKLHGGYSALMEGSIREALVDLTGGVCEKWKLEDEKIQEEAKSGMIWTKLAKFCTWGYVMACVYKPSKSGGSPQGDEGLLASHAYSIIACRVLEDGTRLVKLHSCWGCGGWNGPWGRASDEWNKPEYAAFKQEVECVAVQDEGLFWMPYTDFVQSFNRIYVNRLFPPFWHQLTLHCGWHGTAAGGPYRIKGNLSSTWPCNPQFRITSRKSGEVLLCLQQKDPQILHGAYVPKGDREFSYGLVLFRTTSGCHGRLWELEDSELMHDTGLTSAKEVAITIKITPKQPLLAVPYASRHGLEGPFVLRSFSSLPVEVEQLAAPLSLVVSGHWNGCSAGGHRQHPTWASNPQYMLNVEHRCTVVISLSRPDIRHSIIPPKFKPEEILSLVVTSPELSDEGLGPRLGIRSEEDVVAEKDGHNMEECVLRLELQPETPYVLVPSLAIPDKEAPFELRILSGIPLELTPLPQKRTVTLKGSWTGELSGGCNLNSSWCKNPTFSLTTTVKGTYRISLLLCKGRWKRNQALDRMIGFYILTLGAKGGEDKAKQVVLAETPFVPEHTTSCQYELHSNANYVVMPTTYAPNQLGDFTLSVTSTEGFTFERSV